MDIMTKILLYAYHLFDFLYGLNIIMIIFNFRDAVFFLVKVISSINTHFKNNLEEAHSNVNIDIATFLSTLRW